MPKQIPGTELDAVLSAAAQFPRGGSVREISDVLALALPHRTLQRRLASLAEMKRLIAEGRGRASRYRCTTATAEAEAIQPAVHEPVRRRRRVGCDPTFLDGYRPNETFYLPGEIRQRLLESGRSPDGEQLPAGTCARQIFSRLMIDLSWNSSRLEGNTYSLLEAERLLESGASAEGKDAKEAQMILNHKAAIELLADQAPEIGFNRYTILNLHALLSDNVLDPRAGGRLRSLPVAVAATVARPLEALQSIEERFRKFLDFATAIQDPFEQAFFAMVHLPCLEPFEDLNECVSRLAANLPLIRLNLCPLSFVDVPERAYVDGLLDVRELNRMESLRDVFVRAYERSCARYSSARQSPGEPDPFRLQHRVLIAATIVAVVRGRMDKKAATALIRQRAAANVPQESRARFVEVVETEMMSLHDGNIARYRLRPSEYQAWRKTWG